MLSLPIGILLTLTVIFFSVEEGTWGLYINTHAIILVVLGTLTIMLFSTPTGALKSLARGLRELFKGEIKKAKETSDFKSLAATKSLVEKSHNPLINYAVSLWESGVNSELFIVLLAQRRYDLENEFTDAVQSLRNLAKYPPALGMTGTVIGLVKLFSQLGSDNKAGLGPALALAMTATFFGLIMANAVITPLADRLHVFHMSKKRQFNETFQILLLINRGDPLELITGSGDDDAVKAA